MERVDINAFKDLVYNHKFVVDNIVRVKDIDNTFNVDTEVIDFDKVSNACTKGGQTLASCDCLKIDCKNEYIDFIELKTFNKFIEHNELLSKLQEKAANAISKQVTKFNFSKKIDESLAVYNELFYQTKAPICSKGDCIEPSFFLLTDINNDEPFADFNFTMTVLSDSSSYFGIAKNITTQVDEYLQTSASMMCRITTKDFIARYL